MCLGIPGEVVAIRDDEGLRFGKVRFAGVSRDVCLECVPEARVGDYVLVHVGFAIARLDAEEAARTYRILEELGETEEMLAAGLTPDDLVPDDDTLEDGPLTERTPAVGILAMSKSAEPRS